MTDAPARAALAAFHVASGEQTVTTSSVNSRAAAAAFSASARQLSVSAPTGPTMIATLGAAARTPLRQGGDAEEHRERQEHDDRQAGTEAPSRAALVAVNHLHCPRRTAQQPPRLATSGRGRPTEAQPATPLRRRGSPGRWPPAAPSAPGCHPRLYRTYRMLHAPGGSEHRGPLLHRPRRGPAAAARPGFAGGQDPAGRRPKRADAAAVGRD